MYTKLLVKWEIDEEQVVKMLIIVVCLFVLCWMPLHVYNFLSEIYPDVNRYKYINIIWFCSNWLAMSNSCYNPFIYGLLNEKFKREYRRLFQMCYCKKRKYHDSDLVDYSDDSASPTQRGSLLIHGKEQQSNGNSRFLGPRNFRKLTESTDNTCV